MIFNGAKQWFAMMVGLLSLVTFAPILAVDGGMAFEVTHVTQQGVMVSDTVGNSLGNGEFHADISGDENGHLSGKAELQTSDFRLVFEPTTVEVLYGNGQAVVGLSLRGQGTKIVDGHVQTFTTTVTVQGGATTSVPDCLIWDIPSNPVVLSGLHFVDVYGTIQIHFPWDQDGR